MKPPKGVGLQWTSVDAWLESLRSNFRLAHLWVSVHLEHWCDKRN